MEKEPITIKGLEKLKEYKYGFSTDIENIRAPKGLNEEVIKFISSIFIASTGTPPYCICEKEMAGNNKKILNIIFILSIF